MKIATLTMGIDYRVAGRLFTMGVPQSVDDGLGEYLAGTSLFRVTEETVPETLAAINGQPIIDGAAEPGTPEPPAADESQPPADDQGEPAQTPKKRKR